MYVYVMCVYICMYVCVCVCVCLMLCMYVCVCYVMYVCVFVCPCVFMECIYVCRPITTTTTTTTTIITIIIIIIIIMENYCYNISSYLYSKLLIDQGLPCFESGDRDMRVYNIQIPKLCINNPRA